MTTPCADVGRLRLLVASVHETLQDATKRPDDLRRKLLRCAFDDIGLARDLIWRALPDLERTRRTLTLASIALADAIKTARPLLRAELQVRAHEHVLSALGDINSHLAASQKGVCA